MGDTQTAAPRNGRVGTGTEATATAAASFPDTPGDGTIDVSELRSGSSVLLRGRMAIAEHPKSQQEDRKMAEFVYVPAGFDVFKCLPEILSALGISSPQLAFHFDKADFVEPPLDEEELNAWTRDVMREILCDEGILPETGFSAAGAAQERWDPAAAKSRKSRRSQSAGAATATTAAAAAAGKPLVPSLAVAATAATARRKPPPPASMPKHISRGISQEGAGPTTVPVLATLGPDSEVDASSSFTAGTAGTEAMNKQARARPSTDAADVSPLKQQEGMATKQEGMATKILQDLYDQVLATELSAGDLETAQEYVAHMPNDHPATLFWRSRVRAAVDGIARACAQTDSVFLISRPFAGNVFSEIACSVLYPGVAALGCFVEDDLQHIDPQKPAPKIQPLHVTIKDDELRDCYWADSRRTAFQGKLSSICVPLKDEPRRAVLVDAYFTEYEQEGERRTNISRVKGGMAGKFTHSLVFSSKGQREEFVNAFESRYSTGLIMAGGSGPILKGALECMTQGRPLFVLRGTGGASDIVANICDYYEDCIRAGSRRLDRQYIKTHFTEQDMWRQASNSMKSAALTFVRNFPSTYRPSATEVFDLNKPVIAHEMQEKITRVMASVYDDVLELGGRRSEVNALDHAIELRDVLKAGAQRYKNIAWFVLYFNRMLILTAIILSLVYTFLSEGTCDFEALPADSLTLFAINAANVVVPLAIAVLTAIFAAYRPVHKFAALYQGAMRIDSEQFRYRTRTGEYRILPGQISASQSRERFSERVKEIWAECAQSDVQMGAMTSVRQGAEFTKRVFNSHYAVPEERKPAWERKFSSLPRLNNSSNYVSTHGDGGVRAYGGQGGFLEEEEEEEEIEWAEEEISSRYNGNGSGSRHRGQVPSKTVVFSSTPPPSSSQRNIRRRGLGYFTRGHGRRNSAIAPTPSRDHTLTEAESPVLGAQAYIQERILPELEECKSLAPKLNRQYQYLVAGIIIITSLNSALAAFDLDLWIPMLLGISALLEFIVLERQVESNLPNTNACASTLVELLAHWDGLALIKQRMPRHKELLVDAAESAILLRHNAFVRRALRSLKDLTRSRESDDDRGPGESSSTGDATTTKASADTSPWGASNGREN